MSVSTSAESLNPAPIKSFTNFCARSLCPCRVNCASAVIAFWLLVLGGVGAISDVVRSLVVRHGVHVVLIVVVTDLRSRCGQLARVLVYAITVLDGVVDSDHDQTADQKRIPVTGEKIHERQEPGRRPSSCL